MNEIKETQTTLNNIGNDEDILKEKEVLKKDILIIMNLFKKKEKYNSRY